MSNAVHLWDDFVARGYDDADVLAEGAVQLIKEELGPEALPEMAFIAFSLAAQALLLGVSRVGRLAATIERCLGHLETGSTDPAQALPLLASATSTLKRAFVELREADKSGARIEDTPVDAAIFELETLFPVPGQMPRPTAAGPDVRIEDLRRQPTQPSQPAKPSAPPSAVSTSAITWEPDVDEDMLELFFEEANDRLETLSVKLLEIENHPDDAALLRDVFRDLHTIKGSSAMVNLSPMTRLSHAAEDLVGQLREGQRSASKAVIDSLLAAVDKLRELTEQAQAGQPVETDFESLYSRLRQPESAPVVATPAPIVAPAIVEAVSEPRTQARQTIRVDFDKLDRLMNLVGELILGRDGLGSAISALSALSGELATGHQLSRRMAVISQSKLAAGVGHAAPNTLWGELGDELSRVERVLVDICYDLDQSSGRLDSISADLRDSVMNLRMVPVGGVLRKHHRTVRDLAGALGKKAKLVLEGEETELDKLLVEALDEPLMHLVRNAVDHGVETTNSRAEAGKPLEGTITLSAKHRGNQVLIEIQDDGKGIDPEQLKQRALDRQLVTADALASMTDKEALELIFHAGFSTAEVVSEISGRGVGMDVVRQTIISQLKGTIDIDSELGKGSTISLRMPLTLAISQVLLARAGGEVFALPLDAVARTIVVASQDVQIIQNRETVSVQGQQVPLIRVGRALELVSGPEDPVSELQVVLCEHGESLYGLVVEALLGKKEIVIKSLGDILEDVPCVGGATLIGDRCAVILDVAALIRRAVQGVGLAPMPVQTFAEPTPHPESGHQCSVLLVEDSDIVRESLRRLLVGAGYRVVVACDGIEGLAKAQEEKFDLVSTDVMMPRMDGYELTRTLRATEGYRDTPIIMVTSRGERIDRIRGFDAGVDEYITKPHDRHLLLRTVNQLLGVKT